MVYQRLRWVYLLEVDMMQILVDHEMLSIVCHVGIHVDFVICENLCGSLGLHTHLGVM